MEMEITVQLFAPYLLRDVGGRREMGVYSHHSVHELKVILARCFSMSVLSYYLNLRPSLRRCCLFTVIKCVPVIRHYWGVTCLNYLPKYSTLVLFLLWC